MRRLVGAGTPLLASLLACQQTLAADDRMLLLDHDGLTIRMHLQAGLNVVAEHNVFWNYADTFAPSAGFDSNKTWLEGYVLLGLSFTQELGGVVAYGKVSAVASGTLGIDAYATGNTGRVTLEEGYLGLRSGEKSDPSFDVSVGPREFKAGTGMLLANGGSSGFDRGALKLGPRKAWEMASIGRFGFDNFTGTAFYLDANEQNESDSHTRIVGGEFRYDGEANTFAGMTFGHVLKSDSPYPKAAPGGIGVPTLVAIGRDGLNFVNGYGRATPFGDSFENFFVAGDVAYQWNEDIDMRAWGGRVQVGYTFAEYSWAPTIAYSYQTFSGDDPSTSRLERFDPLYYEGSPSSLVDRLEVVDGVHQLQRQRPSAQPARHADRARYADPALRLYQCQRTAQPDPVRPGHPSRNHQWRAQSGCRRLGQTSLGRHLPRIQPRAEPQHLPDRRVQRFISRSRI